MGNILQIVIYILYGACVLFVLTVLCMYRNIQISIGVLQTSSVIILGNIRMLFIPFGAFIAIIGYFLVWLWGFGYLMSCANIVQPKGGSQLKSVNLNGYDDLKWKIALYVFGLFWISELLSAIFIYCIIVGVCTWYFTSSHDTRGNFSMFKGLWYAFRYNMGSLAFGSFLLAIIWTLRVIFEYIDKKLKNFNNN